jgi:hypothetical protein
VFMLEKQMVAKMYELNLHVMKYMPKFGYLLNYLLTYLLHGAGYYLKS